MSSITVSFRVYNNANKTKQTLKVCAKLEGSKQYHPRTIDFLGKWSLVDPDLAKFNTKKQRFQARCRNASANNEALEKIEDYLNHLIKENDPQSIDELWKLVEDAKKGKPVTKKEKTLEWFLLHIIKEMRDGKNNKLPSANFQVYTRLLHHLERENSRKHSKHILRVPISKITDAHFKQFGDYLRGIRNSNYIDTMKYFKRAHNIAKRKKLASATLSYRYQDDKPPKTFEELQRENKGIASLTSEQICQIENLDLEQISLPCRNREFYKQLYLDTVLLMFYLYTRPIDILNMKHSNIRESDKGRYIEYLPIKKKNSPNAAKSFVRCPINAKAMAIIERYKGMSKAGYILPYSENKKDWDLSVPSQYHTRYNRCNAMLGKINKFLKKVGDALKIFFHNDTFTTYIFRHSAISIAISDRGVPPIIVAKMAGTSLKEIERSYMDHTANMFDYV